MTPAKKKQATTKRGPAKAAPVVQEPVAPPKPELAPRERKFFAVVNKRNAIGVWLISLGSAFCLGFLLTDKAHLHEKVVLIVGGVMIVLGALMIDFDSMKQALGTVKDNVLPFTRKNDPPPSG